MRSIYHPDPPLNMEGKVGRESYFIVLSWLFMTSLLRGPKPTKNLLDMIEEDRDLSKFAEALRSSELDSRLSGSDFFTVFAPSDEFIRDADEDFVMRH